MAEELMRPERLQIMLSPEELTAVERFPVPEPHAEPGRGRSRIAQARIGG